MRRRGGAAVVAATAAAATSTVAWGSTTMMTKKKKKTKSITPMTTTTRCGYSKYQHLDHATMCELQVEGGGKKENVEEEQRRRRQLSPFPDRRQHHSCSSLWNDGEQHKDSSCTRRMFSTSSSSSSSSPSSVVITPSSCLPPPPPTIQVISTIQEAVMKCADSSSCGSGGSSSLLSVRTATSKKRRHVEEKKKKTTNSVVTNNNNNDNNSTATTTSTTTTTTADGCGAASTSSSSSSSLFPPPPRGCTVEDLMWYTANILLIHPTTTTTHHHTTPPQQVDEEGSQQLQNLWNAIVSHHKDISRMVLEQERRGEVPSERGGGNICGGGGGGGSSRTQQQAGHQQMLATTTTQNEPLPVLLAYFAPVRNPNVVPVPPPPNDATTDNKEEAEGATSSCSSSCSSSSNATAAMMVVYLFDPMTGKTFTSFPLDHDPSPSVVTTTSDNDYNSTTTANNNNNHSSSGSILSAATQPTNPFWPPRDLRRRRRGGTTTTTGEEVEVAPQDEGNTTFEEEEEASLVDHHCATTTITTTAGDILWGAMQAVIETLDRHQVVIVPVNGAQQEFEALQRAMDPCGIQVSVRANISEIASAMVHATEYRSKPHHPPCPRSNCVRDTANDDKADKKSTLNNSSSSSGGGRRNGERAAAVKTMDNLDEDVGTYCIVQNPDTDDGGGGKMRRAANKQTTSEKGDDAAADDDNANHSSSERTTIKKYFAITPALYPNGVVPRPPPVDMDGRLLLGEAAKKKNAAAASAAQRELDTYFTVQWKMLTRASLLSKLGGTPTTIVSDLVHHRGCVMMVGLRKTGSHSLSLTLYDVCTGKRRAVSGMLQDVLAEFLAVSSKCIVLLPTQQTDLTLLFSCRSAIVKAGKMCTIVFPSTIGPRPWSADPRKSWLEMVKAAAKFSGGHTMEADLVWKIKAVAATTRRENMLERSTEFTNLVRSSLLPTSYNVGGEKRSSTISPLGEEDDMMMEMMMNTEEKAGAGTTRQQGKEEEEEEQRTSCSRSHNNRRERRHQVTAVGETCGHTSSVRTWLAHIFQNPSRRKAEEKMSSEITARPLFFTAVCADEVAFGRRDNPHAQRSLIVAAGFSDENGNVLLPTTPFTMRSSPSPASQSAAKGFRFPSLNDYNLLVCHNAKQILLHCWEDPELVRFLRRGGRVWCTMLAEYLLSAQRVRTGNNSLAECCYRHLAASSTTTIEEELYANAATAPISTIRKVLGSQGQALKDLFAAQVSKGTEQRQLCSIVHRMDSMLQMSDMEYRGIAVDETEARAQTQHIKREVVINESLLLKSVPTCVPLDLRHYFDWSSQKHLQALIFGGRVHLGLSEEEFHTLDKFYDVRGKDIPFGVLTLMWNFLDKRTHLNDLKNSFVRKFAERNSLVTIGSSLSSSTPTTSSVCGEPTTSMTSSSNKLTGQERRAANRGVKSAKEKKENLSLAASKISRKLLALVESKFGTRDVNVRLILFDIETTGLNVSTDKIVEMAFYEPNYVSPVDPRRRRQQMASRRTTEKSGGRGGSTKGRDGGGFSEHSAFYVEGTPRTFTILTNPEMKIPPRVQSIHGISDSMVRGAPTTAVAMERLGKFFSPQKEDLIVLVSHNTFGLDEPLLRRAMYKYWGEGRCSGVGSSSSEGGVVDARNSAEEEGGAADGYHCGADGLAHLDYSKILFTDSLAAFHQCGALRHSSLRLEEICKTLNITTSSVGGVGGSSSHLSSSARSGGGRSASTGGKQQSDGKTAAGTSSSTFHRALDDTLMLWKALTVASAAASVYASHKHNVHSFLVRNVLTALTKSALKAENNAFENHRVGTRAIIANFPGVIHQYLVPLQVNKFSKMKSLTNELLDTLSDAGCHEAMLIRAKKSLDQVSSKFLQTAPDGKSLLTLHPPSAASNNAAVVRQEVDMVSTATTRTVSCNPSCQNIPKDDKSVVRKLFKSRFGPRDGFCFEVDYSQLEIGIMANLCGDPALCEDLNSGIDFHVKRASSFNHEYTYQEIFDGVARGDPKFVALRKGAKTLSFQRLYGGGVDLLHRTTKLPKDVIRRAIQIEEIQYPGISQFQKLVRASCLRMGNPGLPTFFVFELPTGCRTAFNARDAMYNLPPLKNYPIQGYGAELVQIMLGKLYRNFLAKNFYNKKAFVTNFVHDSVWLDCHRDAAPQAIEDTVRILSSVHEVIPDIFPGVYTPVAMNLTVQGGSSMQNLKSVEVPRIITPTCRKATKTRSTTKSPLTTTSTTMTTTQGTAKEGKENEDEDERNYTVSEGVRKLMDDITLFVADSNNRKENADGNEMNSSRTTVQAEEEEERSSKQIELQFSAEDDIGTDDVDEEEDAMPFQEDGDEEE